MVNILIPLGGQSVFFDQAKYHFTKHLIDIKGKPMIQLVLEPFLKLDNSKFIFVVREEDCIKYHLDSVLNLITKGRCEIIKMTNDTKGAVCSCLMAIEHIENSEELIIANGDQVIKEDYSRILENFRRQRLDSAVVIFESLHPQWSYVRLDNDSRIIETTEKNPISKHAIAGFYYFKEGRDFVQAAMTSILKEATVKGNYYVAPTLNEFVLQNKNLGVHKIRPDQYFSFYSPNKIKEYEKKFNEN